MLLDHCYASGLLLIHFNLKKKSFGEEAPHLPIFAPPWIHPSADLAKRTERMCRALSTSSLPSFVKADYNVCAPIHIHALVHPLPSPEIHKKSLKFFKHINLLYKHSTTYKHTNYTKQMQIKFFTA